MNRGLPAQTDRTDVLVEVALQLGATPDLDSLLPLVLHRVADLLQADRALFALYDDAGRVTRAVTHNLEWAGLPAPLPVSSSLVNQVLRTGEVALVRDTALESMPMSASVSDLSLRFMIGVPVPSQNGVTGVIYLDSTAVRIAVDPSLTQFVVALSRLVGMAVENARLLEEQRLRRRLLGALVHDLRTPLSVMLTNLDMLRTTMGSDETAEMVADFDASCRRMSRMVTNTLELSLMGEESRLGFAPRLGIGPALRTHMEELSSVVVQHGLTLAVEVDEDVDAVQVIESWVWVVVDNLVFWGVRHARAGSTLGFHLSRRCDAGPESPVGDDVNLFGRLQRFEPDPHSGYVVVTMRVPGLALGSAERGRLFRLRAGDDYGQGQAVSGLGLAIVQQCVGYLGGRVWVSSDEAGTSCHFTLPGRLLMASSPNALGGLPALLADDTLAGEPTWVNLA